MKKAVGVSVLTLVGVMVACGGDDPAPAPGTEQPPPAATGTTPPVTPPAPSTTGTVPPTPAPDPKVLEAARVKAINQSVSLAGKLTTDKKADPAPVKSPDPVVEKTVDGTLGSYICKYTDYSLTKVPEKFVALNPNADVLWPGSLIQGKSMAGGILDPIPVKRAPGTITLTIASGGTGSYSKTMDSPSLSAATKAQNDILSEYTGATPAKFSYVFESVYSSEQLAVAVNANVEGTNWAASAALSVDKSDEKSRFLIQFSQEFFTMAFDPPQGAAGIFDPSVTADDLKPYTGDGNPPVYVSSVTYGRIFYILFESSASQVDLAAAVNGSYSGGVSVDVATQLKYRSTVNSSTVKAYGIGGNAESAISAVVGQDQWDQIRKFLIQGANFSNTNPGVPISYTIRNLTDSSQVKLALTTEYTAKDCVATSTYCDVPKKLVLDKCNVCGGDGTTCDPCPAQTVQQKWDGSYVNFNCGARNHGFEAVVPDGDYYAYASAYCHHITWGNIRITCKDGKWTQTSGSVSGNVACPPDVNASWSSGDFSISTGYQP